MKTTQTTPATATHATHYIGMNGTHGCMPDSCGAYHTESDAIESLSDLLELTDEQTTELQQTGIVECTPEQGADYASVTPCNCGKPWEHDEQGEPDGWPQDVLAHVKAFVSTLGKIEYQDRIIEHDSERCRCADHDTFHCRVWTTRTFFCLPYASFGDYDNSSGVERSNARIFNELPYVTQRTGDYGSVSTGIDETDLEHITFEQLTELQEQCDGLSNYPCLDEEDVSRVEMELQQEAWDSWCRADFKQELLKQLLYRLHYGLHILALDVYTSELPDQLETRVDELPDEIIDTLFHEACEDTNTYWQIESGGNAYIDLKRVVAGVSLDSIFPGQEENQ